MQSVQSGAAAYDVVVAIDYDRHLRLESDRFLQAVRTADPDQPVPTCPEWTAADLLWHLGKVQHFWAEIVIERLQQPGHVDEPERPESYDALEHYFTHSHHRLMNALTGTGDEVAVWTWYEPDRTVGFIRRRQAHEALVHRLDADATVGREAQPVDAELATDGVDEALTCFFSGAPEWARTALDGPAGQLSTSDTNRRWLVQLGHFEGTSPDSGTTYAGEPMLTIIAPETPASVGVDLQSPSFDISATAADLMAWIWNRPTRSEVVRRGDTSAIESLFAIGVH